METWNAVGGGLADGSSAGKPGAHCRQLIPAAPQYGPAVFRTRNTSIPVQTRAFRLAIRLKVRNFRFSRMKYLRDICDRLRWNED